MTDPAPDAYPRIFISATDPDLPAWFSNGFEKYANKKQMAGGGNGVLLTMYDNNLGRSVCIKKLLPHMADKASEKRRFLREARVTAQLQHPNTVPVYEMGRDTDGQLYFAMKKVEGFNLFQILGRIARNNEDAIAVYTLDRLLGILIQASNALAYAHSKGVIHRDVKPENIMLGQFGEVILMDWGVAKVWGEPDDEDPEDTPQELHEQYERITMTGQRPGTPLYMSPEQVTGQKHIDERTDIYSMGVVLYELLALREPFRGKSVVETFDNILHKKPKPPSESPTKRFSSKRLDEVCLKAMQKEPRDRYQSIQQFINDIRDYRNDAMESTIDDE